MGYINHHICSLEGDKYIDVHISKTILLTSCASSLAWEEDHKAFSYKSDVINAWRGRAGGVRVQWRH